ncbi:MAG: multidrug effflux MFS transporter [Phyllobacterium sp.]
MTAPTEPTAPQAPQPAPLMSERRVALIGAFLTVIGPISMAVYTPAMPEIVHAFGTTESAVKLTLSLYFAGFAIAQLICGPLSDGFGRRPITLAFMAIYLAASVLALFAPDVHVLMAARFLQGVGAAAGIAISRALVRDLFTHESSTRIMNMIGIMLAIGPAVAPTLGGVVMEFFGWHAIFLVMVAMGLGVVATTLFAMQETVKRDLSRIRPRALAGNYRRLLTSPYFMLSAITIAGTTGALYAWATMLPFIMMNRIGFSASQFGLAMLLQSGSYFFGSLAYRRVMRKFSGRYLVRIGLIMIALATFLIFLLPRLQEPTLLNIMGPVGLYAVGIAFIMPSMTTAAMAPFPHFAGASSAMLGFMQMGGGLVGSAAATLMANPLMAFATIIPVMGTVSLVSWLLWNRLPEPPAISIVRS